MKSRVSRPRHQVQSRSNPNFAISESRTGRRLLLWLEEFEVDMHFGISSAIEASDIKAIDDLVTGNGVERRRRCRRLASRAGQHPAEQGQCEADPRTTSEYAAGWVSGRARISS